MSELLSLVAECLIMDLEEVHNKSSFDIVLLDEMLIFLTLFSFPGLRFWECMSSIVCESACPSL